MHYYVASVVFISINGERQSPKLYTVRAADEIDAEEKLEKRLEEELKHNIHVRGYESTIAVTIGYDAD